MKRHLVDCTRMALAAHDAMDELSQRHSSIPVVQDVKQCCALREVNVQGLKISSDLRIGQDSIQSFLGDHPVAGVIDRLEDSFEVLHELLFSPHVLRDLELGIIVRRIEGVFQKHSCNDSDQRESYHGDISHKKHNVDMANLVEDGPRGSWPIACKRDFIQSQPGSVGRPKLTPYQPSVAIVCSDVLNEVLQEISDDEGTDNHEDQEKNHGPKKRGREGLTSFQQQSEAGTQTQHTQQSQGAQRAQGPQDVALYCVEIMDGGVHYHGAQVRDRKHGEPQVQFVRDTRQELSSLSGNSTAKFKQKYDAEEAIYSTEVRPQLIARAGQAIGTQILARQLSFHLKLNQEGKHVQEYKDSTEVVQERHTKQPRTLWCFIFARHVEVGHVAESTHHFRGSGW
mmetsp:Transcript_16214/g.38320  ORF Transcript_16214/g.38320 Transcript_16214/m.38320 type:complete len:397 (-) Transcript_16214:24-1214(-)